MVHFSAYPSCHLSILSSQFSFNTLDVGQNVQILHISYDENPVFSPFPPQMSEILAD